MHPTKAQKQHQEKAVKRLGNASLVLLRGVAREQDDGSMADTAEKEVEKREH
jgi:hypothetical protein